MAHFFRVPFIVKTRFFTTVRKGNGAQLVIVVGLSYLSDLDLGAFLVLVAHDGVVGEALEGGELVQVNRFQIRVNQFSPFFTSDCYEKNAI